MFINLSDLETSSDESTVSMQLDDHFRDEDSENDKNYIPNNSEDTDSEREIYFLNKRAKVNIPKHQPRPELTSSEERFWWKAI